ncbi:MAG: type II toxin-antitoxin system RelE/ParE family toxin [Gammaproteobacteria bacterium]
MASYKITFKKSVKKDLRKIDPAHLPKILRRLEKLAVDPRPAGCKKLSTKDIYRVRQGSYRIVYEIMDDRLIVIVVAVGSRGSVYS